MNKKLWYSIPFILIMVVIALFAMHIQKTNHKKTDFIGKQSPEFSGYSVVSDKIVSSKNHPGRFLIVKFFGTWCKYCQVERPLIKKLALLPNVDILAISVKDTEEDLKKWQETMNGAYKDLIMDDQDRIAKLFMINAIPETFVINPQGIVVYHHEGALTQDIIRSKIMPFFSKTTFVTSRTIGDNIETK